MTDEHWRLCSEVVGGQDYWNPAGQSEFIL